MSKAATITCMFSVISFFLLQQSASQPQPQGFKDSHGARTLNHDLHCSRETTRATRKIIDEYLMPFVEKENYQIPHKCRMLPENDIFHDQELHKIHVDVNEWKCGYCKKSFRAEKYIDKHFDNRHYNLLNLNGSRCLADLCGVLHCDFILNSKSKKTKCNPSSTVKYRHLCESLADKCFPINQGPSSSRLHELFLQQFCDAHTCSPRKLFPRGGRNQSSVFYLAIAILTLMLLPFYYAIYFLHQRETKGRTQKLKRAIGGKSKSL